MRFAVPEKFWYKKFNVLQDGIYHSVVTYLCMFARNDRHDNATPTSDPYF